MRRALALAVLAAAGCAGRRAAPAPVASIDLDGLEREPRGPIWRERWRVARVHEAGALDVRVEGPEVVAFCPSRARGSACARVARTDVFPDGTREGFDRGGDRVARYRVVDGQLDGPITIWRAGELVLEGHYRRGQRDGLWRELGSRAWFADGALDGEVAILDASGAPRWTGAFHRGARTRASTGTIDAGLPPPPAPYPWARVQADLATGLMLGTTDSVQVRVDASLAFGDAHAIGDGARARGGYLAFGPELALDLPWAMDAAARGSIGPAVELGWAFDRHDPASRTPDRHVYLRVAPYWSPGTTRGLRAGVGLTAPAHARRVARGLAGMFDDDPAEASAASLVALLARTLVLATAPVWTIDHVELATELTPDGERRAGLLLGWGW